MEKEKDPNAVLDVALYAARLLLQYGGETYRAEESMERICGGQGYPEVDAVALSTSIILTLKPENREPLSRAARLRSRSIDLGRLDRVNSIVRRLSNCGLEPEEGLALLRETASEAFDRERGGYPPFWLCSALSSGFFAVMVGGGALDFIIAAVAGCGVYFCSSWLARRRIAPFMTTLVSSILGVSVALILLRGSSEANFTHSTIGALMPMFPGLSMSVAVRDSMQGDLLSGVARGMDALLTAVALGAGAVIAMRLLM